MDIPDISQSTCVLSGTSRRVDLMLYGSANYRGERPPRTPGEMQTNTEQRTYKLYNKCKMLNQLCRLMQLQKKSCHFLSSKFLLRQSWKGAAPSVPMGVEGARAPSVPGPMLIAHVTQRVPTTQVRVHLTSSVLWWLSGLFCLTSQGPSDYEELVWLHMYAGSTVHRQSGIFWLMGAFSGGPFQVRHFLFQYIFL